MSVNQPFGYYGGKQRLATRICELLPPHRVYVEPFAGGASVFWRKGLPPITNNNNYRECLNDQREVLVNFFRVLQNPKIHTELEHAIRNTLYSRAEFERARDILKRWHKFSSAIHPIEVAWAWWVGQNQSFAGVGGNAGWGTHVVTQNGADTHRRKCDSLTDGDAHNRLRSTHIECRDALQVIKTWDSTDTLFYVDPPYPDTDQGAYKGYTKADFDNLIATLSDCQGSFVLSCYPNDAVPDDWPKVEYQQKISAVKSVDGKSKPSKTECVWIVDRSNGLGWKWTEAGWVECGAELDTGPEAQYIMFDA